MIAVALAVVALLLFGPRMIDAYVDWLWFGELGYRSVFTTKLVTRVVVFLVAAVVMAGIVFAAPVMVLLTLVSILIGLLNRVVQHLNVLEIGFTMRVTIALAAMCLFAPLMEPAMEGLHGALVAWLERGVDALEA